MSSVQVPRWDKIKNRIFRRPVRVVEALIVLAGVLGWAIAPEAQDAIITLVTIMLVGNEISQTKTTPTRDPRDKDGAGLMRVTINKK